MKVMHDEEGEKNHVHLAKGKYILIGLSGCELN